MPPKTLKPRGGKRVRRPRTLDMAQVHTEWVCLERCWLTADESIQLADWLLRASRYMKSKEKKK